MEDLAPPLLEAPPILEFEEGIVKYGRDPGRKDFRVMWCTVQDEYYGGFYTSRFSNKNQCCAPSETPPYFTLLRSPIVPVVIHLHALVLDTAPSSLTSHPAVMWCVLE